MGSYNRGWLMLMAFAMTDRLGNERSPTTQTNHLSKCKEASYRSSSKQAGHDWGQS